MGGASGLRGILRGVGRGGLMGEGVITFADKEDAVVGVEGDGGG